jgi:hypothetical protein
MTAKQRAARAKFKAVVAEAKKLRKKNPKLTQAQAVKQAFAISYSKAGKSKVGAVKKSKYEVGDLVYSYQNKDYKAPISYKKFVPWESLSKPNAKDKFVYKLNIKGGYSNYINEESLSKSALGAVKKKSATRVKAKKSRSTEMHTDTKSHNVNIRVVSGIEKLSNKMLDEANSILNKISNLEVARDRIESRLKYKQFDKDDIPKAKAALKIYKDHIRLLKRQLVQVKKYIK